VTKRALQATVLECSASFQEREAVNPDAYPKRNIDELYERGILSAPFPGRLGGSDAKPGEAVRIIETIAAASPSTALIAAMPLGLAGVYSGCGSVVPDEHRASWDAQVDKAAAEFGQGRLYAACNSEKGAGGSVKEIKTAAAAEGDAYALTGEKILASSGTFATYFFSTAKLDQGTDRERVEVFVVRTDAPGVHVRTDWDGFGMRSTESHGVVYTRAVADHMLGWPNFIDDSQSFFYWYCLFAAIPLGCARAMLRELSTPVPQSAALRLRLIDAHMAYESLAAYLQETASMWHPGRDPAYAMRVVRTKTYVTQQSTKLCAELFALSGGRHYTRGGRLARTLADSFAGTALRPPLTLGLDMLLGQFEGTEVAPST
jgi:alkylation response protein AidB-like acyl-CoA dehydrogenase